MRSLTAFLLVLVAIIATFVAVPANWAKREVLDRDRFVALMEPLARDTAVQDALAAEITQQAQRLLSEQGIRVPAGGIAPLARTFVRSDRFPGALSTVLAEVHTWLLERPTDEQRLRGETSAQINLAPMLRAVALDNGLRLTVNDRVTIDLSGTGGNRDLFRAGRYAALADGIRLASWLAPLIAILAAVLALFAAHRRGFLLAYLGLGAAVAAGVTWMLCVAAPSLMTGRAGDGLSSTVFDAAMTQVTHSLTPWIVTEAAVGGAFAVLGAVFGGLGVVAARRADRRAW